MPPHERLPFSAIEGRPPLKLPDGPRLIVWPLMRRHGEKILDWYLGTQKGTR